MSHPINKQSEGPTSVNTERLLLPRLTNDGTPGGLFSITGDYSIVPQEFWFSCPPGKIAYINTLDVFIQGAGVITANGYGPISALPNGLLLSIQNAAGDPLTPPVSPRSTGEFKSIPGTLNTTEEAGPGDNFLNVEWSFAKTSATPVVLRATDKIVALAQDDFTGLTAHFVTISGYILDEA